MENELMELVLTAIGVSPIVTGIVQIIKKNVELEGLQVIVTAVLTAVLLFGAVALVYQHPLAESLLLGVVSGFASIGAFQGMEKGKEFIKGK